MSDFSIPGVPGASKYDTDKMVEELMKAERAGLDRMQAELDTVQLEKSAWQRVNRDLSQTRDSARALFSFENPFNERVAASSDESLLTATASRQAELETTDFVIKQVAGRDRFLSGDLPENFEVSAGDYSFTVGEKTVSFTYHGGTLRDFAEALNNRSKDLVRARVVKSSDSTQVLLVESMKTGGANTLKFEGDALALALESGILTESNSSSRRFAMEPASFTRLGLPLSESVIRFENTTAIFPPDGEARVLVSPPVAPEGKLRLKISFEVITFPYEYAPPQRPAGPAIPEPGRIAYEGIEIHNEPSVVLEPDWSPPPPPEKRDNLNVFYLQGTTDGSATSLAVPLPPIGQSAGRQTIDVALADYIDVMSALQIRNANTHREIHIKELVIFDPDSRGDYTPVKPVETASDARIEIEGIEVRRDTNAIDDLLPGVVLNLRRAAEKPVELAIKPDLESIKNAVIEFVGYYDELMAELNILTGRSEDIIEEITYLSDSEKADARERLGLLQGDITVMQMKSRLQTILMNPYETSLGRELSLLDQIGISTNAIGSRTGSLDRNRLRGYLQIDEDTLDQALQSMLPAVKELFGRDSDSDLVVDSGVAYLVDAYIRPYVETGGLITSRIDTIDGRIARTSTRIETEQEKLEKKEREYRRDFALMEASLNSLEQSSRQIDNFNRDNTD
ncbi:MAG: flagellar filament capping protein FliD [Spirochaetales bacterium]|nr:flagellar filament capping protein FliD [Spirochaetales bacterium]